MYDLLIVGAVGVGVVGAVYFKNKHKKNNIDDINTMNEDLKNEISISLGKLEEDFNSQMIAYLMPTLAQESGLSEDKKEKLIQDNLYLNNDVYAHPNIDFEKYNINIYGKAGTILDEIIQGKIVDFQDKDKYISRTSYEYFLIEKAKEKAQKIVKETI